MEKRIVFLVFLAFCFIAQTANSQVKKIALTFDADLTENMEERLSRGEVFYDPEVIEILQKEKVPSTIFLTALWAINHTGVVRHMADDTVIFEFGNHTYSHKVFDKNLNQRIKEKEIQNSTRILELLTNQKIKLFRFPGGINSKNDSLLVEKFGQKVIRWDIASGDAFGKDEFAIFEHVVNEAKPGAIVVFHLGGPKNVPKTAKALKLIIPYLKEKGYEFVKVSEL